MNRLVRRFAIGAACAGCLVALAVSASLAAGRPGVDSPIVTPPPKFPLPAIRTLANGLRVAVFTNSRAPIVQVQLLVPAGASTEPDTLPGLAALTAMLVDDGTSSRTGEQFASELAALGATFNSTATRDYALVACGARASAFEAVLELTSDAALNAIFEEEPFVATRRTVAQRLGLARQSATSIADDRMWGAAFGNHPYGHSASGDIQSLLATTRENVAAFYRARWRPDRSVLTISGDITPDRAFAAAEEWFGRWSGKSTGDRLLAPPTTNPAIQIVDLPGALWSEVRLMWIGPGRTSADALAWPIVATGLDQSGLPAGARVTVQTLRDASLLTVAFGAPTDSVPAVTRRVRDAVHRYAAHPPTGEALLGLRRRSAQAFPLSLETLGAYASQWLACDQAGLPADALARQYARLVTGVDLGPALREVAGMPVSCIAGPADVLREKLLPLGSVTVVPHVRAPVAVVDTLPAPTADQARRGRAAITAAVLAHGGATRLAATHRLVLEGEMILHMGQQEIAGQFSHVRVDPDRMSFATRMLKFESRQVLVADTAWTLIKSDSTSLLSADSSEVAALKQTLHGDLVHLLRDANREDSRPARRGSEVVSGRTCDLVDFVAANGTRWRFAIDSVNHRVLAIDGSLGGDLRWKDRRVLSQFGRVDGLLLPMVEDRFSEGELLSRFTATLASTSRTVDPAIFRKPRLFRGEVMPGP